MLNEYQKRDAEARAVARAELEKIAAALGEGWTLKDDPENACTRYHYMTNGQGRELLAEIPWNNPERFEFRPSSWPNYRNAEQRRVTVDPSSLYPREERPSCTAARSRAPEAIARDVGRKVLPEYERLYQLCEDKAEQYQRGSNREGEAIAQLFKATRETRNPERPEEKPRFVREIEGPTLYLEYRSEGSVKLDLSAVEAAAVVEFLRERRASHAEQ
jgi:hypothetical protein